MPVEKLHFKIGLAGMYWDKKPQYSIAVNSRQFATSAIIDVAADEIFYVEFDTEVNEGPTELAISLENKSNADVVKDNDDGDDFVIVKDLQLNIKSIEIDDINLGNLIYSHSTFTGDDPARPVLNNCIDLGWNGTWTLKFSSPFYIWLLENV